MKVNPILAAALCLGLGAPALACGDKEHEQGAVNAERGSRAKGGQQARDALLIDLQGQLVDLETIQVRGEEHVIATLLQPSGREVRLDLGPMSGLDREGVTLRPNQRLRASGTMSRLEDRPVLVVDRLMGDGMQTVIIMPRQARRAGQEQLGRAQRPRYEQEQRFEQQARRERGPAATKGVAVTQGELMILGKVVETRDVNLSGIDEAHRLVKLRTRDGKTVVVDLGKTGGKLEELDLQRGKWIACVGAVGRINGRPVVFAEHVADVVKIDRKGEQSGARERQERTLKQGGFEDRFEQDEATPRRRGETWRSNQEREYR